MNPICYLHPDSKGCISLTGKPWSNQDAHPTPVVKQYTSTVPGSVHCDYQNDGTTITQPGKFEGEPVFAPHFWNLGLEGFADDDDGEWFGFKITAEDVAKWPQLAGKNRIALHEDAAGFVWSYLYP